MLRRRFEFREKDRPALRARLLHVAGIEDEHGAGARLAETLGVSHGQMMHILLGRRSPAKLAEVFEALGSDAFTRFLDALDDMVERKIREALGLPE